jgi:peptidoglycan/LPS O-acetylase OafA/YrhL
MGLLRLFLALSVVVWHLPNRSLNLLDAGVAVLFFFIISGFYMALVINERYGATQLSGWRHDFYLSRLFRLFPTYLLVLLFMVVWFKWTDAPSVLLDRPNVPFGAHLALAAMNLFIIGQDFFQLIINSTSIDPSNHIVDTIVSRAPAGFFENEWMLIGQAWSLASELLFYALAPFVVRSIPRIIALLIISLVIRFTVIKLGLPAAPWGYNFFPATLSFFLLGSLAYHLYDHLRRFNATQTIGTYLPLGLALFAGLSFWKSGGILITDPYVGYDTVPMWASYITFAAAIPFLFARWKKNSIDRLIGELSYPL